MYIHQFMIEPQKPHFLCQHKSLLNQRCWKGAEVKPTLERFLIALKSLAGIVKLLLGCLEKEPPYLSTMVTC